MQPVVKVLLIRPQAKAYDKPVQEILASLGVSNAEQVVLTPSFGGAYDPLREGEKVEKWVGEQLKGATNPFALVLVAFSNVHCDCHDADQLKANFREWTDLMETRLAVTGHDVRIFAFEVRDENELDEPMLTWAAVEVQS